MTRKLSLLIPLVAALSFACKSGTTGAAVKANTTCPMSGEAVSASSFMEYKGHKIYTCCDNCLAKVKENPEAAYAKAYPNQ
jgi:YHS domain-containing protein